MKQGFTLIEVMTVLGVIIILGVVAFIYLSGFTRERSLTTTAQSLAVFLRDAQQRSIVQEEGRYWGVKIENLTTNPDRFSLFSAPDTTPSSMITYSAFAARNGVEVTEPATGLNINVIFDKISGRWVSGSCPSASANATVQLALIGNPSVARIIKIYCNGHIE